jgi:hypothetical protein
VHLTARTTAVVPSWCRLGRTVRASAPTCLKPIVGTVTEVSGLAITLRTAEGMYIAVDVEDCRAAE